MDLTKNLNDRIAVQRIKPALQTSRAQRNLAFEWFLTVVVVAIFAWTQTLTGNLSTTPLGNMDLSFASAASF
jgi:hypothetical protein